MYCSPDSRSQAFPNQTLLFGQASLHCGVVLNLLSLENYESYVPLPKSTHNAIIGVRRHITVNNQLLLAFWQSNDHISSASKTSSGCVGNKVLPIEGFELSFFQARLPKYVG